jgi:hypothetical protein
MGGSVRTEEPAWIIARTDNTNVEQLFFGGVNNEWTVPASPAPLGTPMSVTIDATTGAIQEVFDANGETTETITVIANDVAWRSTSADGLSGIPSAFPETTLRGARGPYIIPGTTSLAVVATAFTFNQFHFVEIPAGTAPVGTGIDTTGEVRDIAFGEVGGLANRLDVVTIENGAMRVYRDIDMDGVVTQEVPRSLGLSNDDLLAIGNFYTGPEIEILVLDGYALGVKGCYRVEGASSDMIADC